LSNLGGVRLLLDQSCNQPKIARFAALMWIILWALSKRVSPRNFMATLALARNVSIQILGLPATLCFERIEVFSSVDRDGEDARLVHAESFQRKLTLDV
jgi:hypothetical protein